MMPWFMATGARLLTWEHDGIVAAFLQARCTPPSLPRLPCMRCTAARLTPAAQGLQQQPLAAVAQFKSYLLCGLLAWLLLMLPFAPLLYYCSRYAAHRLFSAKERKLSV